MQLVGRYRIVEIAVELWTDDEILREQFGRFLAPFEAACPTPTRYDVKTAPGRDGYVVTRDGIEILFPLSRDLTARALLWRWNSEVMERTRGAAAIHAGAVCLGQRAIILPGDSGAGKSTLVGALIAEGFEYVSDEGALLDLEQQTLAPYPRPLALDTRSLRLIGVPSDPDEWTSDEWLVPAETVRPGSLATSRPTVGVIAFLDRSEDFADQVVSKATAVRMLAERTPNLALVGERGFRALVAAVTDAVTLKVARGDPPAVARRLRCVLQSPHHPEMSS